MAAQDDEEELLRSVALQNAQEHPRAASEAEEALQKQSEWLRVTLASIGDAVISTDAAGAGHIHEQRGRGTLTGWPAGRGHGRALPDVFHIVNEQTRQPVENPALRALQEGTIVGLANHTVLIARDGTERPIDDSAAPMRDEAGSHVRCGAGLPRRHRAQAGRGGAGPAGGHRRVVRRRDRQQDARRHHPIWNRGRSGCSATRPRRPWAGRSP